MLLLLVSPPSCVIESIFDTSTLPPGENPTGILHPVSVKKEKKKKEKDSTRKKICMRFNEGEVCKYGEIANVE